MRLDDIPFIENYSAYLLKRQKYTSGELLCQHPRIIVNPCFNELLWRYKCLCHVYSDGYVSMRRYHGARVTYFLGGYPVSLRGVDYENYKDTFILDEDTGERFPVYILVPCNHCDLCQKSKRDAMSHRCVLESMCYKFLPWFVTLTYSPRYLPKDGVSVRDVQLFLKRLRINLFRSGYPDLFRYYCAAEYTPKGRAHYHLIIWNLHPFKDFSYYRIVKLIEDSWSMGFVYPEVVGGNKYKFKQSPDKCFDYVSKYIGKGSDVPNGKNKTFYLASNRHGGIAAPFLDKYVIPTIRTSLNTGFQYMNWFAPGGRADTLVFHRYILNRCFPTFSQSVSLKLRNAYKQLLLSEARLHYSYKREDFERVYSLLKDKLPSPRLNPEDVPLNPPSSFLDCSNCWCERYLFDVSLSTVRSELPRVDFPKAFDLDRKRKLFVGKMFLHRKPRDLDDVLYKYLKYRNSMEDKLTELC